MPTLCALVGRPLPDRPIDGIDLTSLLDGKLNERPKPLYFWAYDTSRFSGTKVEPYIDPEQQQGTTPLAKLVGGKATRDFKNNRQPAISDVDYRGPRTIIDGRFKLVVHESKQGTAKQELFDLQADPAEKQNLLEQESGRAAKLETQLRDWQKTVLNSLLGADYKP